MPATSVDKAANDDESIAIARHLLRASDAAVLSTHLAQSPARQAGEPAGSALAGFPYGSLVLTACTQAGAPLMLLSDLAAHCQNIAVDNRASLLFDGTLNHPDRLTGARLSVLGRITKVDDDTISERFLRRHPSADLYAGFGDFNFYSLTIEHAHLVAGFGRIHWLSASELALPVITALTEAGGEAAVIEHMNTDHQDAVLRYAKSITGAITGTIPGTIPGTITGQPLSRDVDDPVMIGCDSGGFDLRYEQKNLRLPFDTPATNLNSLRKRFITLSENMNVRS